MRLPWVAALVLAALLLFANGPSVRAVPGNGTGASQALTPHSGILIYNNSDLTQANGVVGGQGTAADPYVIAGWEITTPSETGREYVYVANTDAYLVVENLYIHRNATSMSGTIALGLSGVANVRVADVHTGAGLTGIEIRYSRNVTVTGSTFDTGGIWLQPGSLADAKTIQIGADNLVRGGRLAFCLSQSGMVIQGTDVGQVIAVNCPNLRVADVDVRDVIAGVQLLWVQDATVENSIFSSLTWYGVFAASSTGLAILSNQISYADGEPVISSGILVVESDDVRIELNTLASNVNGLWVGAAYPTMQGRVSVVGNRFLSNRIGALVNAVNGLIYHNDFIGNGADAQTVSGSLVAWDAGYPVGGNFWSGGPTTDRCRGPKQDDCMAGDGIVDTPMPLTNGAAALPVKDRYPLAQPFFAQDLPPSVPYGLFLACLIGLVLAAGVAVALGVMLTRRRRKVAHAPTELGGGGEAAGAQRPSQTDEARKPR